MAECQEQGFSGITSEHFAFFLSKAEQLGIPDLVGKGNSGEASRSGVTVKWSYDPEQKMLTVQCTKSPMLLPCSLINSKMQEAVAYAMKNAGLSGDSEQKAQA
jgi:hypothetical protein